MTQLWKLNSHLVGNFYLTNVDKLNFNKYKMPHPAIRTLILDPEFNENGKQEGKFLLEISFEVESNNEDGIRNKAFDIGRDLFQYYITIISFLVGSPIKYTSPSVEFLNTDTNITTSMYTPTNMEFYGPPVPFIRSSLFVNQFDDLHIRILTWYKKGIEEIDISNSVFSLFIALELLANQFEFMDNIVIERCKKCGNPIRSEPGIKQRVINYLVNHMKHDRQNAKQIWDTRNRLAHGDFKLNTEEKRELEKIRQQLIVAIIKGMKRKLDIPSNEPPIELPPDGFSEVILSIDHKPKDDA